MTTKNPKGSATAPSDAAGAEQAADGAQAAQAAVVRKSAAEIVAADSFAGKGGSFVYDPENETRAPTTETAEHLAKHEQKHDAKEQTK